MVLRVEKRRKIHIVNDYFNTAMKVTTHKNQVESGFNKSQFKKKNGKNDDKVCTYCNTSGHTRETCFKIHGYPYWFSELK